MVGQDLTVKARYEADVSSYNAAMQAAARETDKLATAADKAGTATTKAADVAERAGRTAWHTCGAHHRAELHGSGIEDDGFGGVCGKEFCHVGEIAFRSRTRLRTPVDGARDDAACVGVDDTFALAVGEDRNGSGRVIPDTRQREQRINVGWDDSAVAFGDLNGSAV